MAEFKLSLSICRLFRSRGGLEADSMVLPLFDVSRCGSIEPVFKEFDDEFFRITNESFGSFVPCINEERFIF